MAALLASSGRPGFYLRVLRGGRSGGRRRDRQGRRRSRAHDGRGDRRAAVPAGPSRAQLERALRIPALARAGARRSRRCATQAGRGRPTGNAGPDRRQPTAGVAGVLPATGSRGSTARARRALVLAGRPGRRAAADAVARPVHRPAAAPRAGGPPLYRSYSLSGPPAAERYRVSVKREPQGGASDVPARAACAWATSSTPARRAGASSCAAGEGPVVLLQRGHRRDPRAGHAALAGRRGVRPRSLVAARCAEPRRAIRSPPTCAPRRGARPRPEPRLLQPARRRRRARAGLRHGRTSRRRHARRARGARAAATSISAGLRVHATISRRTGRLRASPRTGSTPRSSALRLAMTPGIAGARRAHPASAAGRRRAAVRSSPSRAAASRFTGRPRARSLLELAEACDVPVRWACRTGVCHTCESGLVSGSVNYDPEPLDPPAEGNVLICCSRPSDDLVLDL